MNATSITKLEKTTWHLIYVGLFAIILGIASRDAHQIAAWSLGVIGAVAVATGIVLIWVRSRMHDDGSGAESKSSSEGTKKP